MSQHEIYNQGRVVGYSAYEMYLRHHLASGSISEPATESEWLASSLCGGSSIVIKLCPENIIEKHTKDLNTNMPVVFRYKRNSVTGEVTEEMYSPADDMSDNLDGTNYSVHEIEIPSQSNLYAVSTLIGSPFIGTPHFKDNEFIADYIQDYGPLISNTPDSHPTYKPTTGIDNIDVPISMYINDESTHIDELNSFNRIVDGVVIVPAMWERNNVNDSSVVPYMKMNALFNENKPKIRVLVKGEIKDSLNILLSGFNIDSIVSGISGRANQLNSESYYNGDFLGPQIVPWAVKIMFYKPTASMPNFVINADGSLSRDPKVIEETADGTLVESTPVAMISKAEVELGVLGTPATEATIYAGNTSVDVIAVSIVNLPGIGPTKIAGVQGMFGSEDLTVIRNYITVGDKRIYFSDTEPAGDIPEGSIGIGW